MSRYNTVGSHATKVIPLSGGEVGLACIFHKTAVVRKVYDPIRGTVVTLNSGGWRTNTTKLRMNQFAHEYCGGSFSVYQRKGEWLVSYKSHGHNLVVGFEDGMELELGMELKLG